MKLIGLKTCDTCRKARKALSDAGWAYDVVDVRDDGLDESTIALIIAQFGAAAVNKSSTTWRGLSDAEKTASPESLLLDHPTLLKRPVIYDGDVWTIGWKADAQTQWIARD